MSSDDTGIAKRPGHSNFTDQEIELGLRAVAICSGNTRRAEQELAQEGVHLKRETLRMWANKTHAERYQEIRREILPRIKAELAEAHTAIAKRQVDVSGEMLDRLQNEIDDIPIRDLSGAMRNVDVGSGIHSMRGMELRGEATSIVEHRASPDELQRKLERLGIQVVDGHAEEVTDAEVVKPKEIEKPST